MPSTAPPFPSAGSPHLDIELRELYARVKAAEAALGIGEGSPSVPPCTDLTLTIIEATPVKLLQAFVRFDEGWAVPGGQQPKRGPILLGIPAPPFVVLDVIVNLDVPFNYEFGQFDTGYAFGVGTSVTVDVDPRRYYASTGGDASRLRWLGEELVLSRPNAGDGYANIGVVQTESRPVIAGFFRIGPPPSSDWPADMRGQVQVLVLYADSDLGGREVSLAELANHTLLSPTGLVA